MAKSPFWEKGHHAGSNPVTLTKIFGMSPSGMALALGARIPVFDSPHSDQFLYKCFMANTRQCKTCRKTQSITNFPYFSTKDAGRKFTCKACTQESVKVRRELRKIHAKPEPDFCPICEKFTTNWILDHCHITKKFRGYICNSCNLALGRFNDDVRLLEKSIAYLQNKL